MAITIIQTGTSLQSMDDDGVLTALTLPADVTLDTTVKPRWAVYNNNVILVNTPSQPLAIDSLGTVRVLTPRPPRLAPIIAGVAGGTLTGTYRVKETFVTLDTFGNILSESDFGPVSSKVSIAAKFLGVSNADVSTDAITLRRFYRTTDNGAVFFQWVDLDGNVITTIQDDLADIGLSLFGAPVLGTPPRLTTIAEFRGRLWGVGDVDIDTLRYTEAGLQYAWPVDNTIAVPGAGADRFGVVGLLPRREALGVGRRNMLMQVTGTGIESNGTTDFDCVILSRELGIESQESMKVFRDIAYFLWQDGVYAWGPGGIKCISDGTESGLGNVRNWFVTDSYFNRDKFSIAFAQLDIDRPAYRLFLASADSDTVDSWIEFDIDNRTWWGPHSTTLFSPTCAFNRCNDADRSIPMIGAAASVFAEQEVRSDGASTTPTAIVMDVVGKRHAMDMPDSDKYFGELSMLGVPQTTGTLQVKTRAGDLAQTRTITQYYDMRKSRQRLGRLGTGRHAQVELYNANANEDVEIFGYEIDPVNLLGRR